MIRGPMPWEVGGYVLAGGQSSRMGRDKALLPLAGKSLVQHAVTKLGRICREVAILSARPELAGFGRLVPDVHPGCGPLGGMEAALLDTRFDWNLFLPVDVPFLPLAYLQGWLGWLVESEARPDGPTRAARVMFWTADGRSHPTVALLHRALAPHLTAALERGERRLQPVLETAARASAAEAGFAGEAGFWKLAAWPDTESVRGSWQMEQEGGCTPAQEEGRARWFANLNTPEEFAEAERHVHAMDI